MKRALLLFLALIITSIYFSHHQNSNQVYQNWKSTFGFEFQNQEDIYRSMIFAKNLEIIQNHNSDPSQTYKMGINQFTGLTQQQFVSIMLHDKKVTSTSQTLNVQIQRKQSNANIDWTTKGQVSPVKNQGQCGSCWAFSAVAVLQSLALSKGQTVNLSEQQLVDCSLLYGNFGCEGGQNYGALAYVRDHGITDTQSYPYVAKNQFCKIHGGNFKISHVNSVSGCENIQSAIQQRPIGIAVDATNWSKYASGIFNNCGNKLNHNVLLVGMTDAHYKLKSSYYKVKNSWGTTWGEQGFIRLALGNTCGICDDKSPWAE